MSLKTNIGLAAVLAMATQGTGALAASDLELAIQDGAEILDAQQIQQSLVGNTATFVTASGDKTFLVYYGENNQTVGSMVGGDWTGEGFHAVTDRNQICLGWAASDLPKLRCMEVLSIEGVLHKYGADGSLSGRITNLSPGNNT